MWNQFKFRNVEKFSSGRFSSTRLNATLFMTLHSSPSDLTCSGRDPQIGPANPPGSRGTDTGGQRTLSPVTTAPFLCDWKDGGGGVGGGGAITEGEKKEL